MPIEDRLLEVIQRLLSLNSYNDVPAKVRIQASLKTKGGYKNDDPDEITLLITADRALPDTSEKKMIVSDTRVVPKECKPAHLKLSNMLHYRQAAREAQKAGVDDAVMLTTVGLVAESSIANIFWKREDKIYTPSEACDILPGITRNSLLELLDADDDYRVKEGEYQIEDLQKADAAWLTNSVMGIVPVSEINGRRFNNKTSFFHQLTDRFKTLTRSGG
jgi:branched-subunit amino acid aminotransferase/4-amino-4-deoxychorismate lyase